jgi:hypothetical protein
MSDHIESEALGDGVTEVVSTRLDAIHAADPDAYDATHELSVTPPAGLPAVTADDASPNGASDADDHADPVEDDGDPIAVAERARGRHTRQVSIKRSLIAAVIAAAVVLAGAGIALAVTSGGHGHKRSSTPPVPAPPPPPGPPCPLTGVPTTTTGVPHRPALAIKIDNYPQARPQSGLDKADIVFEEPVEGGITRLVAVFQCQSPSLAGPIRSARAVDLQILDQLSRPVFLHVGGINPVINMLQNGNLIDDNLFYRGSIVQHPPGRYAPYSSYVSGDAAWGLNPSYTTPPAPLFQYSGITPAGTAVTSVHIPFAGTNDVHWAWDAPSGHWLLSWGSSPAMVANGGQIAVNNIVVQTVHVTYGPWLENDVGGYEVQSQLVGSGPLTVLRNGIAITGKWQRSSISTPTSLVSSTGTPIPLAPGTTWVEIVPSSVTVTTAAPAPSRSAARTP